MPISTPTFKPSGTISIGGATTTKITNFVVATPNNEESHALTSSLKKLIIRCRGNATLKFSFTSTESGTKYITVPKWCNLELSDLDLTGTTLYFQTSVADTVEILELY